MKREDNMKNTEEEKRLAHVTENEKILAEEVGRPIAEVARGRAYLSECAVYGKGLRQVFALWVRPRAKVVVHGFVEPQPL